MSFASDGILLYSGARMDSEILCWDLRNPGCVLYSFPRAVSTNQRIYFDLSACSTYVLSGESQQELWLGGRAPYRRTMPHKTHKKTVRFKFLQQCRKTRFSPCVFSFVRQKSMKMSKVSYHPIFGTVILLTLVTFYRQSLIIKIIRVPSAPH